MQANPEISLIMIARDSARSIGEALASAKPYVDEIVVIDTGSTDETEEIARGHGAKVWRFPWTDSFAQARNESIRRATGDWLFWMDTDDVLPAECGEKLRALINQRHDEDVQAFVMQVHCPAANDRQEDEVTVVDHVKLFRNGQGYQFRGRIHEQVIWSIRRAQGQIDWTDLYVVHANSRQDPESLSTKIDRDLRLLEMELADDPESSFTMFNLGMTLHAAGRVERAADWLGRSALLADAEESHTRKVYALWSQCWMDLGRPRLAFAALREGQSLFPGDPELLFRAGLAELRWGSPIAAVDAFRSVLVAQPDRYFSSIDRSIFARKARSNLALALERSGEPGKAVSHWVRTIRESPTGDQESWHQLLTCCIGAETRGIAKKAVTALNGVDPPTWAASVLDAMIRRHDGQHREASAALGAAVESSGNQPAVLEHACHLAYQWEDHEASAGFLGQLVALQPENAAALHNLGVTELRMGRFANAAEHLRRSLELRPAADHTQRALSQAEEGKSSQSPESPRVAPTGASVERDAL